MQGDMVYNLVGLEFFTLKPKHHLTVHAPNLALSISSRMREGATFLNSPGDNVVAGKKRCLRK